MSRTPIQRNGKGGAKKKKKEQNIKYFKTHIRTDAQHVPSGSIGVGPPPEGFTTWAEWVDVKYPRKK